MPNDPFENFVVSLTSPANSLEEIAPNDNADIATVTRAINVAVAGIVRVTTSAGQTGNVYVGAGIMFPIRVTRIWSTGTTASGIVGLF